MKEGTNNEVSFIEILRNCLQFIHMTTLS